MSIQYGRLFIVATPIGNLGDITDRAKQVLREADIVLAEDTRHSAGLLAALGIKHGMRSLHEHNERHRIPWVLEQLATKADIALISDAGTPLISDPGYPLVRAVREAGYPVVPVPGPCAPICALSASGLPTDRFCFEGFLASRPAARRRQLLGLKDDPRTLVFFETPHRIGATLADMADCFGEDRPACLARELTKRFETIMTGTLRKLRDHVASDADSRRGEMVVMIRGNPNPAPTLEIPAEKLLTELLADLPLKQAVKLAARISGERKNALYERATAIKATQDG